MSNSGAIWIRRTCWIAALLSCAGAQAATVWQRDWDADATLGAGNTLDWRQARLQDSGDLFLPALPYYNQSLYRLGPDASMRWQFSLSVPDSTWLWDMVVLPSQATALIYARKRNHVALLSADGELLWDIAVAAQRAVAVGDQLLVLGCTVGLQPTLSLLSSTNGTIVWQRALGSGPVGCRIGQEGLALTADDSGGIFASFANGTLSGVRTVVRLDLAGNVLWSTQRTLFEGVELYRRGDNVYATDQQSLHAFRASDGQFQWKSTCSAAALQFIGSDPVCAINGTELARLRPADGGIVWQRSLDQGQLLGGDGADLYYTKGSDWQQWSGGNGNTVWQKPFARTMPGYWRLALNASSGKAVTAALDAVGQPHSLHTYRLSDGELLRSDLLPAASLNVKGTALALDRDDLFVAGQSRLTETRLRRLAADSGNIIWDKAKKDLVLTTMAPTPATLAVAENNYPFLHIRSLDRSSGEERWVTSLPSPATTAPPPVYLFGTAQDDVLGISQAYNGSWRQSAWRLSGSDGSELWRSLLQDWNPVTPDLELVVRRAGSDLIVADRLSSHCLLRRIDAMTGVTQWSQDGGGCVEYASTVPDEETAYYLGWENGTTLSRRDLQGGSTDWAGPLPTQEAQQRPTDLAALAGGDVLVPLDSLVNPDGPNDYRPGPPQLLRIKADGSGIRYRWQGRLPQRGSADSVGPVRVDHATQTAWLRHEFGQGPFSLTLLERFDLSTNQRSGAQFFGVSGAPPLFPTTSWDREFDVYKGRILSAGAAARAPLIETRRHALRDFQVQARGDLAVTVRPLPAGVAVGSLQTLQWRVDYSGDDAISATLLVDAPWPAEGTVTCSGSGISDCSVDTRFNPWLVRFNAATQAQLQLDAPLRVLSSPAPSQAVAHAVVFGPESLLEPDGQNNGASSAVQNEIFSDGFD